jgi:glutamine cyclotransferase
LEGSVYFPANQIYYILTWQEHTVFRYRYSQESAKFEELPQLRWNYEGWGMTHNNTHLFISDGSNHIYVTDAELNIKQTLTITKKGQAQPYLN